MSQSNSDDEVQNISEEEEIQFRDLFKKLDVNKDGKIDLTDVAKAMENMSVPQVPGRAEKFFRKYDKDMDGQIDFQEFVKYVKEHEKELKSYFTKIDTNSDGTIDAGEIVESFQKIGIHIEKAEAEKLLKRMDLDGTLKIDWNEWREFLILTPSQSIHDVLRYWRHSSNTKMELLEVAGPKGEEANKIFTELYKDKETRSSDIKLFDMNGKDKGTKLDFPM